MDLLKSQSVSNAFNSISDRVIRTFGKQLKKAPSPQKGWSGVLFVKREVVVPVLCVASMLILLVWFHSIGHWFKNKRCLQRREHFPPPQKVFPATPRHWPSCAFHFCMTQSLSSYSWLLRNYVTSHVWQSFKSRQSWDTVLSSSWMQKFQPIHICIQY